MKKKIQPFLVFLLCTLLQGGTLGMIVNCRGIFTIPICQELGFSVGKLTNYSIFYGIAVCCCVPLAGRMMKSGNLRLLLTGFSVVISLTEFAMSGFTRLSQWYIAMTIQGACYAFLVVITVPMLIHNWFQKNQSTFIGLSSTAGGLVGILMNEIVGNLINLYGWRYAYRFVGITLFLCLVPACLAFSWRSPEEAGGKAYGKKGDSPVFAQEKPGVTAAQAQRTPTFYLLISYTLIMCCTMGFNQTLSSMAQDFGYPQHVLTTFVSAAMVGTIVFKIIIGRVMDLWGIRIACWLVNISVALGFMALLWNPCASVMYLGAVLMGMPMTVSTVLVQTMVHDIFGPREFEKIYSKISIGVNFASNFGYALIGWVISLSHSYRVPLYMGLGIVAAASAMTAGIFGSVNGEFYHE